MHAHEASVILFRLLEYHCCNNKSLSCFVFFPVLSINNEKRSLIALGGVKKRKMKEKLFLERKS